MPNAKCSECGHEQGWRNRRGVRLADIRCSVCGKHALKHSSLSGMPRRTPYTRGWCVMEFDKPSYRKGRLVAVGLTIGQAEKRMIGYNAAGYSMSCQRTLYHPLVSVINGMRRRGTFPEDVEIYRAVLEAATAAGPREGQDPPDIELHRQECVCGGTRRVQYPGEEPRDCSASHDALYVSHGVFKAAGEPKSAEGLVGWLLKCVMEERARTAAPASGG